MFGIDWLIALILGEYVLVLKCQDLHNKCASPSRSLFCSVKLKINPISTGLFTCFKLKEIRQKSQDSKKNERLKLTLS